ncbi:MAG: hypothetical protein C0501_19845 [Isosphaera sp.]|nr:hypothetical protein [Isosphaera sp.]
MQSQLRCRPRLEAIEDRLTPSAVLPPQSSAFGTTIQELGPVYTQRAIEDELGGGTDLPDKLRRVQFLPANFGTTVEFDITLRPGTPFFFTPFFVFGERYDSGPDDRVQDIVDFGLFETAQIRTVLDGRVVLEGSGTDLAAFGFGPTFFSEPIVYTDPQPRGDRNAVAALFVQGIGAVFHPLSVGQHTLVNTVQSEFFGDFTTTYHITVTPPGRR